MTTNDSTNTEPTTGTSDSSPLDIAVLQAEITALQAEVTTLKDELSKNQEQAPEALKELAARAQADLQNAKERMEREKRDIRQYALEGTIMKLLPTIDNFQRAFMHLPEELKEHDWVKGVAAIERDMMSMLSESGLKVIPTVGEMVDTQKHEVLQMADGAKDIVLSEFSSGYMLHEKVLRPAKVQVGNGNTQAAA